MEVALTLRARDEDLEITIVSEESDNFFSRTALMYVLSGQMSAQDDDCYACHVSTFEGRNNKDDIRQFLEIDKIKNWRRNPMMTFRCRTPKERLPNACCLSG